MAARIGLILEPLDLLFFRDGRPFDIGRVGSTAILPQTVAGALRTALLERAGCDFGALGRATRAGKSFAQALAEQSAALAGIAEVAVGGPWFLRDGEPLVPAPASLLRDDNGEFARLAPLRDALPGWNPEEPGMLPLWTRSRERTERLAGYLTLAGADRFLLGGLPARDDIVQASDLFETDSRTGIVVGGETLTAETGMIYAADYLALKPGVSLYVELSGPEATLAGSFADEAAIPLGGQTRYVRLRRRPEPVTWPRCRTGRGGSLLLLTTPAPFAGRWRPSGLDIVAAAVPGHVAVSGWDLARGGPKPTRFAVQAGAVYFCRGAAPDRDSVGEGDDALLGWGRFLEGGWDYA
ncbi:MAG TPA: type III-B CRISPR module-associated protein Cmr3 [Stellaceae bacterium]|jgi:CRISPR-associated protein Cmr3